MTSIENAIFMGCTKLSDITLPMILLSIGMNSFSECRSLRKISIPDSVKSIANNAFNQCDELVVSCSKNSYAYKYCVNNEIKIKISEMLPAANNIIIRQEFGILNRHREVSRS